MKIEKFKSFFTVVFSVVFAAAITLFAAGCDDDEDPVQLNISSLTAGGGDIDLNGATSPTNVPTSGPIVATFNTSIDETTATEANVKIVRDYDDAEIPLTVAVDGATVTITPEEELGTGTLYILTLGSGLAASNGTVLTQSIERNFTTEGTFAPSGVISHFTFEESPEDVVGDHDPAAGDVAGITYVESRNEAAGKAASFDGASSIIEIPNADQYLSNGDFAISFWVNADGAEDGHFVLGLAAWMGFQFEIAGDWAWVKMAMRYEQADGTFDGEDSWYPGNGETKDNGGWQGWTFNRDVTSSGGVGETYFKDKWAHVVVTYNAATKINTMYINGQKVKEHDFNLWPDDSKKQTVVGVAYSGNDAPGNKLALGFIQGRENRIVSDSWANFEHADATKKFKGQLDDIRIFSKPLTETEVSLMYNSEKP